MSTNKPVKVYMGIPSMGERWDFQCYQLREIEERYRGEVELVYPGQCVHRFGHDFSRNEIVEEFLASDCDVLWFLDADVAPVLHVLDLITVHGDKWLAAGAPYPLWLQMPGSTELGVCFTAYKGSAPTADGKSLGLVMTHVPKSGTEWVDGLATGCLFLKRELFSKLEKPYFAFKRKTDSQEVCEGEDLGFAMKLQKLGIKYFCDHGMVASHYKKVDLLNVSNYAVTFANAKIMEFDRTIRSQVEDACRAAYTKGRLDERASADQADIRVASNLPKRTQSGLILPT